MEQRQRDENGDSSIGGAYKNLAQREYRTVQRGLGAFLLFFIAFALIYGGGGNLLRWIETGDPLSRASRQSPARPTVEVILTDARLELPRRLATRAKEFMAAGDKTRALDEAQQASAQFALVVPPRSQSRSENIFIANAAYEWGLVYEMIGDILKIGADYDQAESKIGRALQTARTEGYQALAQQAEAAIARISAKKAELP
jgi:tetratricopeptide (TPR) repeat protein